MPKKVSFRIEGVSELADELKNEFPKATSTAIQKRALMKAAVPMEQDAKGFAPHRTGLLQERIDIGTKLSPRAKRGHVKESKVEVFVGPPSMSRAIVAEFGSVKQAPHPFMRPAWDGNKRSAFNEIKKILEDEIEKTRERIAKRTARLLAKNS